MRQENHSYFPPLINASKTLYHWPCHIIFCLIKKSASWCYLWSHRSPALVNTSPTPFWHLGIPENTKHSGGILTLEDLAIHHSRNPKTPSGYKWRPRMPREFQYLSWGHTAGMRGSGIKVQIACLHSDPALFPPRRYLGTHSSKYKFAGNTYTLNSYQQNQKNKTDICSTKNEMHTEKKKTNKKKKPPKTQLRAKKVVVAVPRARSIWETMVALC